MAAWSDAEILDGFQSPERREEAFRALHLQHGPRLLGFLTRMCHGDRDLAEDLLGRALYKTYAGLARGDVAIRSLKAWLYTVATRTALDELQSASRRDALSDAAPLDEEMVGESSPPAPADTGGAPLDDAIAEVLAALEAEDPRYRTLLEMEHVGVCERGEIAEATGIQRKQLSQYLKRARERFLHHARRHPILAAWECRTGEGAIR